MNKQNITEQYAKDCFAAIMKKKRVNNCIISNGETCVPIVSTLQRNLSYQCARLFGDLLGDARFGFKNIDEEEEINFIRIKTAKDEIVLTPDDEILVIVRQSPP